jgi:hypothetical protein
MFMSDGDAVVLSSPDGAVLVWKLDLLVGEAETLTP